ncbi:MAG: Gfo/Idh/MocA family oxidoreductase [Proteobacteria bacterium]|nr:Gfo/Idh/MocA family oxidoreductase [Pseudomonadota bacterium]
MIRIGVVGAGYWGAKHLRVLHELQGSELYMVCDQDSARLDETKHHYPKVLTTSDYGEMMKSDVDAVVIATPVNSHFQLTITITFTQGKMTIINVTGQFLFNRIRDGLNDLPLLATRYFRAGKQHVFTAYKHPSFTRPTYILYQSCKFFEFSLAS